MTSALAIKFIVAMTIMMNPLGCLSIFLELTYRNSLKNQRRTARTTGITILLVMLLTVWVGQGFLELMGITIPSFRFAGGLILLMVGLSMLESKESPSNYNEEDQTAAKQSDSVGVVPLAVPLIIGPGAISTLVIEGTDYPALQDKIIMSLICLTLALGMYSILYYGRSIAKLVGASIMKVVTRIMGMLMIAIAAGMLAEALIGLIPALGVAH